MHFNPPRRIFPVNGVQLFCLMALVILLGKPLTAAAWPRITRSVDGTPIAYEVFGAGEPALIFVHGWSCDSRYWRGQVDRFAERYRVVAIDLAGHGHSGLSRTDYSMRRFGEDVRAVVEAEGLQRVLLIGHSMGGSVVAEAARLMPDRVVALIGVDTLENIEYPLTREELEQMTAPLEADFPEGAKAFAGSMIGADCPPVLRDWIVADMAAAPPAVALSAMNAMMGQYLNGEAARIFEEIKIPVITVNGDLWPIDYEANRRHMHSFAAIVIEHADHFLMMNRSADFNNALQKAIDMALSL